MNPAHLHLALIHFPIASAFLALPLLVLALLRRGEAGSSIAAAVVLLLGGASAVLALETGERAEEQVEHLPGVSEAAIHTHEERAETAMALSAVNGVVGLMAAGLSLAGRARLTQLALGAALAGGVATAAAMAWTGNAGGRIRHLEIEAAASVVANDYGAAHLSTTRLERGLLSAGPAADDAEDHEDD